MTDGCLESYGLTLPILHYCTWKLGAMTHPPPKSFPWLQTTLKGGESPLRDCCVRSALSMTVHVDLCSRPRSSPSPTCWLLQARKGQVGVFPLHDGSRSRLQHYRPQPPQAAPWIAQPCADPDLGQSHGSALSSLTIN